MRKLFLFLLLLATMTSVEPSRLLAQGAGTAVQLGMEISAVKSQVASRQFGPAITKCVGLLTASPAAAPQVTPILKDALEGDLKTVRQAVASTTATGTVVDDVDKELNVIYEALDSPVVRSKANELNRISLVQQLYDAWADSYCRWVDTFESTNSPSQIPAKRDVLTHLNDWLTRFASTMAGEGIDNSAHILLAQARVRAYLGNYTKDQVNGLLRAARSQATTAQDSALLASIDAFETRVNSDQFVTLAAEEAEAAKNPPAPAPAPAPAGAATPTPAAMVAQVPAPAPGGAAPAAPGIVPVAPAGMATAATTPNPTPATANPAGGATPAAANPAGPAPTGPTPVAPAPTAASLLAATPKVITVPGEETPAAAPTPTPAPASPGVGNIVGTLQGYWDSASVPAVKWVTDNKDMTYPIIAALVILWFVPMLLLKIHLVLGDFLASAFKDKVKHWGILGYISLIMAHVARRKRMAAAGAGAAAGGPPVLGSKPAAPAAGGWLGSLFSGKRGEARAEAARRAESVFFCPACQKPTDIIHDYRGKYRYDACPHCGHDIEPVFEGEDYIKDVIRQLSEMAERKNEKRKWRKEDEQMEAETMSHLTDTMFVLAVQRRASDVHVERGETGASLQMRVDGMLTQPILFPKSVALSFLSALKVRANLDITNHTTPQDGRRSQSIEGVEYDMRINCAPTPQGEIFFMRLLDPRQINMSLKDLGFEGAKLQVFDQAIHKPFGLILVTGPTGAGKSTTLYVALNQVNTGERNIITIEDPVEYQIPGLKQMQVNPEKQFTFSSGLRSILRQDPDIIMIGEIRDKETAGMAIEAAGTGHLVMTTLHTMDTAQAVSRLAELGVSAKRYAPALEVVLAQRLVRTICYACKQPVEPTDADLERVGILKMRHQIHFMGGKGCRVCGHTGYRGRMAILEMLKPDEKMHALLENETRPHVVRDYARRNGMRLLREEAVVKVAAGVTSLEEVIRVAC